MTAIRIRVIFTIRPNKLQDFKAVVATLIAVTREKDHGTLEYEFYLDEHAQRCVAYELYATSEAVLEHAANLVHLVARVAEVAEVSAPEIYGEPSIRLLALLAPLSPVVYSPLATLR